MNGMFRRNDQIMALGTMIPASSTSSAGIDVSEMNHYLENLVDLHICATESLPSTMKMADTCPINVVRPMLLHPAPLSVKLANTSWADCFGANVKTVITIGKKSKQ